MREQLLAQRAHWRLNGPVTVGHIAQILEDNEVNTHACKCTSSGAGRGACSTLPLIESHCTRQLMPSGVAGSPWTADDLATTQTAISILMACDIILMKYEASGPECLRCYVCSPTAPIAKRSTSGWAISIPRTWGRTALCRTLLARKYPETLTAARALRTVRAPCMTCMLS